MISGNMLQCKQNRRAEKRLAPTSALSPWPDHIAVAQVANIVDLQKRTCSAPSLGGYGTHTSHLSRGLGANRQRWRLAETVAAPSARPIAYAAQPIRLRRNREAAWMRH